MSKEELELLVDELAKVKLTDKNIDYYFNKTLEAIKVYDAFPYEEGTKRVKAMWCIYIFFSKYVQFKNGYKCHTEFKELDESVGGHFDHVKDEIVYNISSLNFMLMKNSMEHIFVVFHENRHKLQDLDYKKDEDQLMSIDPMSILMLKESISRDELYCNNHSNYIIENDANLWAYSNIRQLKLSSRIPENSKKYDKDLKFILNGPEMCNFGTMMYDSSIVDYYSDEYKNPKDDTLPIFLEIDKKLPTSINIKYLENYPLFKLIYNVNGRLKSYETLMEDKNRLLKKYENAILDEKNIIDSYRNYNKDGFQVGNRYGRDQINAIYSIIINSSPLLYLENNFSHNSVRKVVEILEENNALINRPEYMIRIDSLFSKYITLENSDKYTKVLNQSYLNEGYKNSINKTINSRVKSLTKKIMINKLNMSFEYFTGNKLENDESEIKSMDVLNMEKQEKLNILSNSLKSDEISEIEYRKCIDTINDEYDVYLKKSKEQESLKNINLQEELSNEQSNNNINSPQHEETPEIKEFYELFDVIYGENLKKIYKELNDFDSMNFDEQEIFEERLENSIKELEDDNKKEGKIINKELKDKLWNKFQKLKKNNPNIDINVFLEIEIGSELFKNNEYQEEPDKIDEVESVEDFGRGII